MERLDIVDLAYQILEMHEENKHLRRERDHYKSMHESEMKSLDRSLKSTKETIGMMLKAVIDPDSLINKGIKYDIENK